MRTGSYVGRQFKTFTANGAAAQPVFTIALPNYACEVRFKIEGSSKNVFAYSWNPKYNTTTVTPNDIQNDSDFYTISFDSTQTGYQGLQTTKEIIWRHAEGMPNALFIFPASVGANGDTILSYSIVGGKNNGY